MLEERDILVTVVMVALVIFIFLLAFLFFLVSRSKRKFKHRAELSELRQRYDQEVIQAEREATENTLSEMGRELHDNVGQLLFAAKLGLSNRLDEQLDRDEQLSTAMDVLDEGIDEVRRLGHSLNSDLWRDKNLFGTIAAEAARLERLGHAVVHVSQEGVPSILSSDEKTILYRVFQEVVNNALKHGSAQVISICLKSDPISISIHDDGVGFDADNVDKGSGLKNIDRRCELIGFTSELTTSPKHGCRWTFTRTEINEL